MIHREREREKEEAAAAAIQNPELKVLAWKNDELGPRKEEELRSKTMYAYRRSVKHRRMLKSSAEG